MNWLARREHARAELIAKLRKAGFEVEEAESTVAGLVADGLQSDDRFAEMFVRSRHRQGQGPFRIRVELEQRGVEAGLIRRHLEDEAYDWFEAAANAARKRWGDQPLVDRRDEARLHQFLSRRGFEAEQVREAVDALKRHTT